MTDVTQINEATKPELVIELDWFAEEEVVRVLPRDKRRFTIHKNRAIKLLQLANDAESQLDLLMDHIGIWVFKNGMKLESAYLTVRDERMLFVAVSKTPQCDDELEDSISDLDMKAANDPDLDKVRMNAIVLPPASLEALESFFDKRFFVEYRVPRS